MGAEMTEIKINDNLIRSLLAIAAEAGSSIMDSYRRCAANPVAVSIKDDASPLTEADLDAHRIIVDGLRRLTPDTTIVSEEDAERQGNGLMFGEHWLVDPLDGTKEFLAATGEFTVNIALVRDGRPVLGIVAAPALDLVYWGSAETGALRRRNAVTSSIAVSCRLHGISAPVRVAASRSHMNALTSEFIAKIGNCELASIGSSLKFCRIAEGEVDCYPRFGPTCEWDTAAGHAILEAAGGQVLDEHGMPLRYGKSNKLNPYFVASAASYAALQARFWQEADSVAQ